VVLTVPWPPSPAPCWGFYVGVLSPTFQACGPLIPPTCSVPRRRVVMALYVVPGPTDGLETCWQQRMLAALCRRLVGQGAYSSSVEAITAGRNDGSSWRWAFTAGLNRLRGLLAGQCGSLDGRAGWSPAAGHAAILLAWCVLLYTYRSGSLGLSFNDGATSRRN